MEKLGHTCQVCGKTVYIDLFWKLKPIHADCLKELGTDD